jgi:hypothetical protein
MSDFMKRQYDVSQRLISMMTQDVQYQRQLADVREHYECLLQERDRKIAKLQSTIDAMTTLKG